MDIILSYALVQHSLDHNTPKCWKSVAFTAAITALKNICDVETSKEKVMSHLKTWNKYYIEVSVMFDMSGFGLDWERNMVKVDSEEVWANYVKAHPSVKHYKDIVVVNWSNLTVRCGTDKATGSHAAAGTETVDKIDAKSMSEKTTTTNQQSKVEGGGSSRRRRKRVMGRDSMAMAIERLADSVESVMRSMTTS